MSAQRRRVLYATLALTIAIASGAALLVKSRFDDDMQHAFARAAQGSVVLQTRCGPIEYQEAGIGVPLLAVHGSGGGHDQGMAFAAGLASYGIRVIAVSRFGYLRTPCRLMHLQRRRPTPMPACSTLWALPRPP